MSATTTDAPISPAASPRRRFSSKLIALVATVVLLVAGGVITAVAVSFHYLHAAPLDCVCVVGWGDSEHPHTMDGLLQDGSAVDNSPTGWHTFSVAVINRSSVTQTILGSGNDVLHETVTVGAHGVGMQVPDSMRFARPPVALHPGEDRYLEIRFNACVPLGGQVAFDTIALRVRVGAFTRTEVVPLGSALGVVGRRVRCG